MVMVGAGLTYLYLVADVTEPPGVVTLMVTVPAVSAGVLTTIFVAVSDVTGGRLAPEGDGGGPVEVGALDGDDRPACGRSRWPGRMW